MQGADHKDLDETPKTTAGTTKTLAANAAHLAAAHGKSVPRHLSEVQGRSLAVVSWWAAHRVLTR
ncbi:hypothetical protein [Umezawaea sp. NPDC059074]|uniref:hypothetical protein n=1 Tax=Umezawaea sp. NPDC059074 TaxID=3346716 RepID=UPI0036B9B1CE